MFSRLVPPTTMWTGWGFNLANKCLVGSRGAESVEPQLVDCSLLVSKLQEVSLSWVDRDSISNTTYVIILLHLFYSSHDTVWLTDTILNKLLGFTVYIQE